MGNSNTYQTEEYLLLPCHTPCSFLTLPLITHTVTWYLFCSILFGFPLSSLINLPCRCTALTAGVLTPPEPAKDILILLSSFPLLLSPFKETLHTSPGTGFLMRRSCEPETRGLWGRKAGEEDATPTRNSQSPTEKVRMLLSPLHCSPTQKNMLSPEQRYLIKSLMKWKECCRGRIVPSHLNIP